MYNERRVRSPRACAAVLGVAGLACGRIDYVPQRVVDASSSIDGSAPIDAPPGDATAADASPLDASPADGPRTDAPASCGDAVCDGPTIENCQICAADCSTLSAVCGNGLCDSGETSTSCFDDCGPTPWTPAWTTVEAEMLDEINAHRAAGTRCPGDSGARAPLPALTPHPDLQAIARNTAWDFSHHSYSGGPRCSDLDAFALLESQGHTGYRGATYAVSSSATGAVDAWMADAGLCGVLMGEFHTLIGVGFADDAGSPWYIVFVTER
jgi:uncharacterized protein YkwD